VSAGALVALVMVVAGLGRRRRQTDRQRGGSRHRGQEFSHLSARFLAAYGVS
jgi:MYXO-CTERM domain-containing protein